MNVAIVGASHKVDRYSNKALKLLREKGHIVFPIHPRLKEIDGVKVFSSLKDISEKIDTITFYVGQNISSMMTQDVIGICPRRIIFNPGAENPDLLKKAQENNIDAINACTLVLLSTQQF
ncbi:MAG: CoA-binding protein [Candidatus Omnitrophica bacterium]|nr:CoA-binding protein [Candidatus Omnitrophota bacterium]